MRTSGAVAKFRFERQGPTLNLDSLLPADDARETTAPKDGRNAWDVDPVGA
jgi:hypothetical protein